MPPTRMHKRALIVLALAVVWLALGFPACAEAPRLALYEVYLNPGCGHCVTVAPEITRLREDYSGVALFLEQRPQSPLGERYSRFWAAYDGNRAYYPLVCVDSGYRVGQGTTDDYYQTQKTMIDEALGRPPQADLHGVVDWQGDRILVHLTITNTSAITLSYAGNRAQAHLLLYEQDAGMTGNLVRAAQALPIEEPLAPGASAQVSFTTPAIECNHVQALRCGALIDYRPGGGSGPYDMLQAVDLPIVAQWYGSSIPLVLSER